MCVCILVLHLSMCVDVCIYVCVYNAFIYCVMLLVMCMFVRRGTLVFEIAAIVTD